jgi:hypothetical protein
MDADRRGHRDTFDFDQCVQMFLPQIHALGFAGQNGKC